MASLDVARGAAADGLLASGSARTAQAADIAARLERLPLTSYQRGIFGIIATAWFFDSMDLAALTFVLGSIRQTFQLSTAEAGLLSSMSFLGMFLGAASAGLLADRFGRTRVFQVSMIFWGLGSILCGLSPTVQTLAAARILLGFGMGMDFPVAQSMVSEMIPAGQRGRYIALLEGFWPLGFICSGLLSFAVLSFADWHWVFILQGIPAIFVLIVRRYVPESPRWLASRGDIAGSAAGTGRAAHVARLVDTRVVDAFLGRLWTPDHHAVVPVVLRAARLLRSHDLARRAAPGQRLPGHQIGLLHDPDFAGGHSRLFDRGLDDRSSRPQADLDRDPAGGCDLLLLLRRRRRPDPVDRCRPLHAVLRLWHVVGALCLYARALSHACAGHRHRLCVGGVTDRFVDRAFGDRLHSA